MSSPVLNPKNTNYLSSELIYNQLNDNWETVTLQTGISAPNGTPQIWLDGAGRAQMQGQLTINTSSVEGYMPLCKFPSNLIPTKDSYFPVFVERAGAYVANAIQVGSGGSAISSITVTNPGDYTAIPTVSLTGNGRGATLGSTTMKGISTTLIATGQSSTGSYAPGDTLTLSGGTATQAATYTILTTGVISATVANGGTGGGGDGNFTVTGTTGTGTPFTANVAFFSGVITGVNSITTPGSYTVNPTVLTAEPVTGHNVTGATLNIKMEPITISVTTPGSYTVLPSNPVSTTTSGSGTGCTLTAHWGVLGIPVTFGGEDYDSTSAVSFSSGTAAASITLGASTDGLVSLVTQPQQNDIVHLDNVAFFVKSYN